MSGPFEYTNSITQTKKYMMESEHDEKAYVPFLINKSLSFYVDTVLYANDMNQMHWLDKKLQYDYLFYSIPAKKRFTKWPKKKKEEDLELIKEYFGYGTTKAKQALAVLNDIQLEQIKQELIKGGVQ